LIFDLLLEICSQVPGIILELSAVKVQGNIDKSSV